MPTSSSFLQHALDLLAGVGPVRSRSMFGGYNVSLNGLSIGIIDDDRLYLRVDDQTRSKFASAGGQPFTYPSKNGPMVMNGYFSLPEEAIDDPDVAVTWGRLALEASLRASAKKPSPSKGKRASRKAAPKRHASRPGAKSRGSKPAAKPPRPGAKKTTPGATARKSRAVRGKAKKSR